MAAASKSIKRRGNPSLLNSMNSVKVYVAGKVSKESVFGTHDWRDGFCEELSRVAGVGIRNLDPTKESKEFPLPETDAAFIFGRDCLMIQMADVVIVNLTDDISVGGSQEMLIAKYYKKPLVGIAPFGGKFYKAEKEIGGKMHQNWKHPFVVVPCDAVVEDVQGAADWIRSWIEHPGSTKTMSVLDESVEYYKAHYHLDTYLHEFDGQST